MKNLLLSLPLLLLSQTSVADNHNVFNFKLGAHGGGFGFGPAIEYRINNDLSFSALYETFSLSSGNVDASSTGIGLGLRYYFNNAISEDYYLNFTVATGSAEASDFFSQVNVDVTSVSLTFGKSWFWNHVNFDAGIGLRSLSIGEIDNTTGLDTSSIEDLEGTGPSINLALGYAF